MMHRTTILLPESIRLKAIRYAQKQGISLGELIRTSLEMRMSSNGQIINATDIFMNDKRVYSEKIPKDLSKQHDNYLYE